MWLALVTPTVFAAVREENLGPSGQSGDGLESASATLAMVLDKVTERLQDERELGEKR